MASSERYPPVAHHEDDDDGWEYEYSTTETETQYLTLDLSVRDFLDKIDENVMHSTRAGYRVWYNPLAKAGDRDEDFRGNDDTAGVKAANINGNDDDEEEEDNDPLSEAVRQRRRAQEGTATETQPEPSAESASPAETIQIMELHCANPLVSYRGLVFRGSWAENIGTEMIFARHDPEADLPVLRHLPENVDLVTASGSRVNFKEVKLDARGHDMRRLPTDRQREEAAAERYKQNGGIYIHVGSDKHGFRRPQANFLEDLTVLKRQRGETDAVTITTVETTHNDLIHDDFDEEQRRKKQKRDRGRQNRSRALLAVESAVESGQRGNGARRRTGRSKGRGPPRGPGSRSGRARSFEGRAVEQQLPQHESTPSEWKRLEPVPEEAGEASGKGAERDDESDSGSSEGRD